jgi:rhamnosyl/mannosyltransferase
VTIRVLTFGRYADENFGGLERYVFELARALAGHVEFANIVARRGRPPDTVTGADAVYARPVLHLGGTPVCPSMPLHALRLHAAKRFNIVHVQFPADPMAHFSVVALPRSVRRVVTWHSDIIRQRTLLRFYEPLMARLLRSSDAIILPTPAHLACSQQLQRLGPEGRTHVVPFGLHYERFEQVPEFANTIRQRHRQRFLIFALGRHVYYKGLGDLLHAVARLPEVGLVVGGTGPMTPSLVAQAQQLRLGERVEFVGRIPDANLPAYYHACDVFCLPSTLRAEAFGLVQLEAMACGKPVVCCDLKNGVTWVNRHEETGLVVPPADPAALAAAFARLRDDALLRARLGAQGRKRAVTKFSVESMARGTLNVYRAILEQPPARSA